MSHEIDELAPGVHAAAFAREDAWHQLGTTVEDHDMSAAEVLELAHLGGWNVRKIGLTGHELTEDGVADIAVPDRWATVRTNPVTGRTEYLGTVGGHYKPIQNEEHVELFDALVGESGFHFDTAGSLRKGRTTFLTMRKPDSILIGGRDEVRMNLVGLNSHDGSSAFRFLVSPIRVVCANTETAAIASARASWSTRHTSGAAGLIAEARETLGLTFKYVEAFEAEANEMIERSITDAKFAEIVGNLFDLEDAPSAMAKARRQSAVDGVLDVWAGSGTLDGIRGTAWGAYNALTEYVDHFAPVAGRGDAADKRAARTLTAHATQQLKAAAFSAFALA